MARSLAAGCYLEERGWGGVRRGKQGGKTETLIFDKCLGDTETLALASSCDRRYMPLMVSWCVGDGGATVKGRDR